MIGDRDERDQAEEDRETHEVRTARPIDRAVGEQQKREHVGDAGQHVDAEVVPHVGEPAELRADDHQRRVRLQVERHGRPHHSDGQQVRGAVAADLDDEERRQRDVEDAERVVQRHLHAARRVATRAGRSGRHVPEEGVLLAPLAQLVGEARERGGEGRHQAEHEPDDRGTGVDGVRTHERHPIDPRDSLRRSLTGLSPCLPRQRPGGDDREHEGPSGERSPDERLRHEDRGDEHAEAHEAPAQCGGHPPHVPLARAPAPPVHDVAPAPARRPMSAGIRGPSESQDPRPPEPCRARAFRDRYGAACCCDRPIRSDARSRSGSNLLRRRCRRRSPRPA